MSLSVKVEVGVGWGLGGGVQGPEAETERGGWLQTLTNELQRG